MTISRSQILLVEDEFIVAVDLQKMIQSLGHDVCGVVASGEEAIEKAAETRPDLVLMDIGLKGKLDGIEAARQIRNRFKIPVIYLTSYADTSTLLRAKETEPLCFLSKPVEEAELSNVIKKACLNS